MPELLKTTPVIFSHRSIIRSSSPVLTRIFHRTNLLPAVNTLQLSGTQNNLYIPGQQKLGHSVRRLPEGYRLAGRRGRLWDKGHRQDLKVTALHMEHINRKTDASDNNVSESRFKTVLFLLRTAGIQLNVKTLSGVDIAYNTITVLCTYVTVLCLYMDSFVHRHNLVEFMEKVHLLAAMHVVIWIHLNLR
jgi:hypothetical protein